jgi:ribosome-associated heat shock protein Hsp15
MRLDKYLWTVRIFKTRSLAAKACNSDHVKLNEETAKASKLVKQKDLIAVKAPPIWRTYKVLDFPRSRVGAPLVIDYILETTSEEAKKEWETFHEMQRQMRKQGFRGRPTKKDRRKWDNLHTP